MTKPRWVECADKAGQCLERAENANEQEKKDGLVHRAHAWMALARLYQERPDEE